MASPLDLVASRAYPMLPGPLFETLLPLSLPRLFAHGYGPIPAIGAVTGQAGEWQTAGQTRTIHLRGGGTMHERLAEVSRPPDDESGGHFAYELTPLSGPLSVLAERVDGTWRLEPQGTGCRVTWRWVVSPRSAAAALTMPVLGRLWRGYARTALAELEHLLLESPA